MPPVEGLVPFILVKTTCLPVPPPLLLLLPLELLRNVEAMVIL